MKYLVIFLFFSCALLGQTSNIKGYLHDKRENKGLAFCSVYIVELKMGATTDKKGSFIIRNIPKGMYHLKAIYVGYGDTSIQINLSGKDTLVRLELPPFCKYDKNRKNKTCPVCNKKNMAIPIIYGLLSVSKENKKYEYETYYPGGCIVSACQPNWYCKSDSTKF